MANAKKTIELWKGYEVEVNEQLLDDFTYIQDLAKAQKENDLAEFISIMFALVGGEKTYRDVEKHIVKEKGYFSQESLLEIISKIGDAFPKAGNRAQEHSWKTSI